jgi:cupin fold WbuC family metalloprotein
MLQIIDEKLMDEVVDEARQSPRLRMNYNFHEDLSDGCQRLLNALEPGTVMPIHHHKVDEIWAVLRGRLRLTIHDDSGAVVESYELSSFGPIHGANIPAGTWHSLECLETGTIILECKEGPYIPHEIGGVLEV